MNREQKLAIARMAFIDIVQVINKFQEVNALKINAHWDQCITVDGELFHADELRRGTTVFFPS